MLVMTKHLLSQHKLPEIQTWKLEERGEVQLDVDS